MFELGTSVKADTRNASNGKFDRQYVALLAGRIVTGCTVGRHPLRYRERPRRKRAAASARGTRRPFS